mmetsp:Transcript_63055/g.112050  ORF Transcript_63055/g.112050 Transcript_63055/m.112050 type:complete len:287 (+) Transcript_63055:1785-2645(+)
MCHCLGNHDGSAVAYQLLDTLQSLWRAEQSLRQRHVLAKIHVLGDHDLEATRRILHATKLHDLCVIIQDVLVEDFWSNEDDISLGICKAEDSGNLRSLKGLIAINATSPRLSNCQRADMNFDTTHGFRLEPILSQLIHQLNLQLSLLLLSAHQLFSCGSSNHRHLPRRLDPFCSAMVDYLHRVLPSLFVALPQCRDLRDCFRHDLFQTWPRWRKMHCHGLLCAKGIAIASRIQQLCHKGAERLCRSWSMRWWWRQSQQTLCTRRMSCVLGTASGEVLLTRQGRQLP